jgi:hypothetical protein
VNATPCGLHFHDFVVVHAEGKHRQASRTNFGCSTIKMMKDAIDTWPFDDCNQAEEYKSSADVLQDEIQEVESVSGCVALGDSCPCL